MSDRYDDEITTRKVKKTAIKSGSDKRAKRARDAETGEKTRGGEKPRAKKRGSGKKSSSVSRALKNFGRAVYKKLLALERWSARSRRNKIITIASASAAGLLLVGGIVLIVSSSANKKPKIEMTLIEEDIAPNYTFVDASEYAGTLLEKSADAGVSYLKETLFVGDSNMARLVMYGLLDYSNVIGVESMGIQGVTGTPSVYFAGYDEPVTIPKAISLMKPRRIIFNFGTNNLLGTDTAAFVDSYGKALTKIKEAYPYCDVILMAIHPLGEKRSNTQLKQTMVDDYNLAIIKFAKANGYPYLDTAEVLKGENGWLKEKFAYTDGIHLSQEGLNAVLSYVRTHSRIVEDARPKPIGSTPTQVAPPPKETDKPFDPALVASSAQSLFVAGGFSSATGHSGTPLVSWNWSWPIEGAEGGTEANVAQSLYSAYLAQNSVKSGEVLIGYSQNAAEYVFSVSVYAAAPKHTHTYTWVKTSDTVHTGTCSDASCAAADKTITHAPKWSDWATDGTTCTRACTGFQGCTVKETHTPDYGAEIVDVAATEAAEGKAHKVCKTCDATYSYTLPKISAHVHSYGAWSSNGTTCTRTCTAAGCTVPPAAETHVTKPSDWIVDVEATETTDGSRHKECTECHCVLATEAIPKTGGDDPGGGGTGGGESGGGEGTGGGESGGGG